ncbi:MAG: GNAT family N-acetyltransferase [Marinobacterium sp.]|nr:GNAT family N-acetyltransferase [Marinobacterium sp.]
MMPVTVLEAGPEMAEQVAGLVRQLLLELSPGEIDEIQRMELFEVAEQLLGAGDLRALLAFQGMTPVGVVTLHQGASLHAGGRFGEISEFYVTPSLRSQGVGKRLLKSAAELALRAGWRRLEVGTPPAQHWPLTQAFYCNNGFTLIGERLRRVIVAD